MKLSAKGKKVSKSFEQLRLKAYRSFSDEPWTIGWGTTSGIGVVTVTQGMTCTKEQADHWYDLGIAKNEARINRLVKVPLTQGQFDALVLFDNNTGATGRATFLKRLNAGDYDAVPAGMRLYVNSGKQKRVKGLIRRREAEIALWNDKMQPKTKNKIVGSAVGVASVAGTGATVYDQSSDVATQVQPIIDAASIFGYSGSAVLVTIGTVITLAAIGYIAYRQFK